MYSDILFNLNQMIENSSVDEAAESLSAYADLKPSFALETGIRCEDIWNRAENYRQCLDLIDDDEKKKTLKNMIYFCAGIMPDSDSVENRFSAVEELESVITDFRESDDEFADRLVAIGSSGIDHDWESVEYEGRDHEYFDSHTVADERDLFALQLTLAKKLRMPFVLHSRKGFKDTADVLKAVKWDRGVIHGFSYSQSELEFFLDMGWYVSFSGTVTYGGKKNFNDMSDLVTYVPKDRILIETDSPYYTPLPLKNVSNSSANIKYVYEYIAAKRGTTIRKLSDAVDSNCHELFGIK